MPVATEALMAQRATVSYIIPDATGGDVPAVKQGSEHPAPPAAPSHATLRRMERLLLENAETQDVDALTSHHFCNGIYARELRVPAGNIVVGKTHASQNLFVLTQGEMIVTTDAGPKHIVAPFVVVTEPGTKRAGYALTDCVTMNFHSNPDNESDLAVLEARYIMPELLEGPERKEIEQCRGEQ